MALTEKLRYHQKISTLSSDKIDKYKYLTDEERLPSDQRIVIEQSKSTYFALGKALGKQTKIIKDQREKQIAAIEDHEKQVIESNIFEIAHKRYRFI